MANLIPDSNSKSNTTKLQCYECKKVFIVECECGCRYFYKAKAYDNSIIYCEFCRNGFSAFTCSSCGYGRESSGHYNWIANCLVSGYRNNPSHNKYPRPLFKSMYIKANKNDPYKLLLLFGNINKDNTKLATQIVISLSNNSDTEKIILPLVWGIWKNITNKPFSDILIKALMELTKDNMNLRNKCIEALKDYYLKKAVKESVYVSEYNNFIYRMTNSWEN